jgi:hypothetical protein
MENNKDSKSSFSLPIILLIATAIAGGVFEFIAPLDSMRPPHEERMMDYESSEENILSRMWQDPFQAVERHKKLFPGEQIKKLPEIEKEDIDDGLLIMPVLTTVGTYAEDIEKRLRSRYAILSALHVAGFKAEDASHIGVFSFCDKREDDITNNSISMSAEIERAENVDDGRHQHLIPYEWFVPDSLGMNVNINGSIKKILVLWIGDAYFQENIIGGLDRLLEIVEAPVKVDNNISDILIMKCDEIINIVDEDNIEELKKEIWELVVMLEFNPIIKRKVIGPSSSKFLKKIYDQNSNGNWRVQNDQESKLREKLEYLGSKLQNYEGVEEEREKLKDYLKSTNLEFYSPRATIDPIILRHLQTLENTYSFPKMQYDNMHDILRQSIHTDRQVTCELVDELERRGISLKDNSKDRIVLISEWDTYYGRALPRSFERSINKHRDGIEQISYYPSKMIRPECVYRMTYMHGIDGMLPDEYGISNSSSKTTDTQNKRDKSSTMGYYSTKFKQPLGLAQYDYMRRIEGRIKKLEFELESDENQGGEIRAIGVLGSDIYDKLLILRALKGTFPDAIFFTNDLDARLYHETELPWTRNLIVASSYGLQLNPRLQNDIPPFRNVYQSSSFVATLQALDFIKDGEYDLSIDRPRIFEIGNRGPYDITPIQNINQEFSLHPERYDLKQKPAGIFFIYLFFIFIFPLLIFWWLVYHNLKQIQNSRLYKKYEEEKDGLKQAKKKLRQAKRQSKLDVIKVKELESKCKNARDKLHRVKGRYKKIKGRKNKPWRYFGPVCILAFAALSSFAFASSWSGVDEPLTFFDGISIWPTELIRLFSAFLAIYFIILTIQSIVRNGREIDRFLYVSKTNKDEDKISDRISLHISNVWNKYKTGEGDIRKCLGIASIFVVFHLGLGKGFLIMFGEPYAPFRGELSRHTDKYLLLFSLVSMLSLAWFVINRIYYCRKFLRRIISPEKRSRLSDMVKINCYVKNETNKVCNESKDCKFNNNECLNEYDKDLSAKILVQWLKLQIISKRTVAIGKMVIYPFIIFALLLVARNHYFDNWSWTAPLIIVVSLTIILVFYHAFVLFYDANTVRRHTVDTLHEEQLKLMNIQIPSVLETNSKEFNNAKVEINKAREGIENIEQIIKTLRKDINFEVVINELEKHQLEIENVIIKNKDVVDDIIQMLKEGKEKEGAIAKLEDHKLEIDNRIHKIAGVIDRLKNRQEMFDEKKKKLIEQKSNYINHIISDIKDLKSGAFAPLGRNPIFLAILAPLGGLGTISIMPHLLHLFNK